MIEAPKTLAPVAPHWFACLSGAVALLVGVLVLVGRAFDVPVITDLVAAWVTMMANTALCFALCGAALWLLQTQGRRTRGAARVCAAIVGGIALVTLAKYATDCDSGIGEFFLREHVGTLRLGRMAPNSALCFALLAAGLWLMGRPAGNARRSLVLGWLGLFVVVIGLIALLGHVTGFKLGYGWWTPMVMSILTASLFVLLGAALLATAWREAGVRWLIEPWISAGFAAGLVLLVVVAAISHRNTERLVEAADRVKHTHKILMKLSGLRRSIDEHQSGMSGFVITGNDSFLPLSQDVILQALKQVRELRELTSDSPGQQRQLAILETQIDDRLLLVRTVIELRRSMGLDEAAAQVAGGTSNAAMDAIRMRLDELEVEEERLLQNRAAESHAATDRSIAMLPVGTVLSLVLLASGLLRLNQVMAARQHATDAQQRSQHRLGLALDAADIGEWVLNPVTLAASRSLKHDQIFGYTELQPHWNYGMFLEHVHPEDRVRVDQGFQESLAASRDWDFECRIIRQDGTAGWIWSRGAALKDDAGRTVEMLGMVRDITVRKRAEEKLRESEEHMRLATAATAVGIWEWNIHTTEIRWDAQMFRLYGIAPTADGLVEYSTWSGAVLPEELPGLEAVLQETIRQCGRSTREFHIVRGDDRECRLIQAVEMVRANAQGQAEWVVGTNLDITVAKAAETALRESAERLRLAMDAAQMGSWDWDMLTGEIQWTPHHEILFGYEAGTTRRAYADFYNRLHPDDAARVEAQVQECLAQRTDFQCEFRVVWPDGSNHWISGFGRFHYDSAGRPTRMLGMVEDITARKQAEDEISRLNAELEQRVEERTCELKTTNASLTDFKAALDEHALVSITDASGNIIYANDKFCVVSKYSREELLGQNHRIVNSGYHPKAFMRDLWQTINGGRVWKGEVKNRAKDGSFYWVATTIVPFLGEDGKPVQFIAIRTDISARKEVEAALELNDFCVRQASMAIFWVAPDARILRVNPAVCELLGYTEPELLSMAITDLDPAFQAERWPSHWQELRELKRMSFETSHKHKDGHLIPIEVDLNWLEFEGREYNFAFVRDVTARKAAEQEIGKLNAGLQSRAARLEIAMTELDAFSYSVAHDLRAPLRAVDGFSRMVIKYQAARLDDNGRRMLGAIRGETQRMARLIDDLLSFSRLGRQQIQPVPIDMHAMAREVFDELAACELERKLRLDLQELPPASGTPEMIRQVWVNLIANAIKFTKERETGEIEIGTREDGVGGREYYVKDNGAGFDTRHAGKLFGVFQRLHSQQEFPGTGVGLALVQRIVQRHGGRARAEAEVDRGATFYFTLGNRENLSLEISRHDRQDCPPR